jgi:hypothetical protein
MQAAEANHGASAQPNDVMSPARCGIKGLRPRGFSRNLLSDIRI